MRVARVGGGFFGVGFVAATDSGHHAPEGTSRLRLGHAANDSD
jgi:hypothetical protein